MNKPIIIPSSYKLRSGKYVPHVILRFVDGPKMTERPLSWDKELNTKEEADRYAVLQAELYIKNSF